MTTMNRFDPLKRLKPLLTGSIKAYKGSGWQLVVASYQECPGVIAEDGLPEPDHWYVSYVSLYEDPNEDDGYGLTIKMTHEHFDPFDAGMKFQELCDLLPERQDQELAPYYPSQDPLEEKAWAKSMFDGAYELARRDVMRELQREAANLKEARTAYPPEESILGQILTEIGILPGESPSLPEE